MADTTKDAKPSEVNVERFECLSTDEESKDELYQSQTMGTVAITDDKDIYLIPAPSADPRGDLLRSLSFLYIIDYPSRSA